MSAGGAMSNSPKKCRFCDCGEEKEQYCGKLLCHEISSSESLIAHKKCMQYSAKLVQYVTEEFGGFIPADVLRELERGRRLRCCLCNKKPKKERTAFATSGCEVKDCQKKFHFLCAKLDDEVITSGRKQKTGQTKRDVYWVFCSKKHKDQYDQSEKGQKEESCSETDDEISCQSEQNEQTNSEEGNVLTSEDDRMASGRQQQSFAETMETGDGNTQDNLEDSHGRQQSFAETMETGNQNDQDKFEDRHGMERALETEGNGVRDEHEENSRNACSNHSSPAVQSSEYDSDHSSESHGKESIWKKVALAFIRDPYQNTYGEEATQVDKQTDEENVETDSNDIQSYNQTDHMKPTEERKISRKRKLTDERDTLENDRCRSTDTCDVRAKEIRYNQQEIHVTDKVETTSDLLSYSSGQQSSANNAHDEHQSAGSTSVTETANECILVIPEDAQRFMEVEADVQRKLATDYGIEEEHVHLWKNLHPDLLTPIYMKYFLLDVTDALKRMDWAFVADLLLNVKTLLTRAVQLFNDKVDLTQEAVYELIRINLRESRRNQFVIGFFTEHHEGICYFVCLINSKCDPLEIIRLALHKNTLHLYTDIDMTSFDVLKKKHFLYYKHQEYQTLQNWLKQNFSAPEICDLPKDKNFELESSNDTETDMLGFLRFMREEFPFSHTVKYSTIVFINRLNTTIINFKPYLEFYIKRFVQWMDNGRVLFIFPVENLSPKDCLNVKVNVEGFGMKWFTVFNPSQRPVSIIIGELERQQC